MPGETALTNLNPAWFCVDGVHSGKPVALQFDCPICPRGCHRLFVPFVSDVWKQERMIWTKTGEKFEDITLSPSIFYDRSSCQFHGWVTNGRVRW